MENYDVILEPSTYISVVGKHVSPSLVLQDPHIQVNLWQSDRVGRGTLEVKALVTLVLIALLTEHHVLALHVLHVDPVPAGWELDIELQLCSNNNSGEVYWCNYPYPHTQ